MLQTAEFQAEILRQQQQKQEVAKRKRMIANKSRYFFGVPSSRQSHCMTASQHTLHISYLKHDDMTLSQGHCSELAVSLIGQLTIAVGVGFQA